MDWLISNLGTIAVALILCGVIVWIAVSIVRDKKSGKSCSCGCENCAAKGCCKKGK